MKKSLLYLYLSSFFITSAFSQNYQISPSKVININDPCGAGLVIHDLEIKNTQEFDILYISWKLVSKNIPSSLSPSFCDWMNCYAYDVLPTTQVDLQIAAADSEDFKLDLDVANAGGTGIFKVEIFETNNPTVRDTVTFNIIACNQPTSIINYNKGSELSLFPNPCNKDLSIKIPMELSSNIREIEVYNIIGTKVSTYPFNHQEIFKINTSNLPEGVYIIKLNGFSENSYTKRFIKIK